TYPVPSPDALPDGPEADVLAQRQEVERDDGGAIDASRVTRDPEAPEADAIEQAQSVPLPPEDELG
ncbi:MAG TPA: hypothetical protein VF230_11760, partial [Acidimicrobiales bacterium]